jgi:hypothetical protein
MLRLFLFVLVHYSQWRRRSKQLELFLSLDLVQNPIRKRPLGYLALRPYNAVKSKIINSCAKRETYVTKLPLATRCN